MIALLGGGAAVGAAVGVGGTAAAFSAARNPHSASSRDDQTVAFFDAHQAGIATPAQDRLHFAAFDLNPGATRAELIDRLTRWTNAAAHMTGGRDVGTGAVSGPATSPPDDTGEARAGARRAAAATCAYKPALTIPRSLSRNPQSHPHRPRHGVGALLPARLRSDQLHVDRTGHTPEHDGIQGRHRQCQGGDTSAMKQHV